MTSPFVCSCQLSYPSPIPLAFTISIESTSMAMLTFLVFFLWQFQFKLLRQGLSSRSRTSPCSTTISCQERNNRSGSRRIRCWCLYVFFFFLLCGLWRMDRTPCRSHDFPTVIHTYELVTFFSDVFTIRAVGQEDFSDVVVPAAPATTSQKQRQWYSVIRPTFLRDNISPLCIDIFCEGVLICVRSLGFRYFDNTSIYAERDSKESLFWNWSFIEAITIWILNQVILKNTHIRGNLLSVTYYYNAIWELRSLMRFHSVFHWMLRMDVGICGFTLYLENAIIAS